MANLKKGFSLIETIVVVSIIILFTGIGIAKYNDFSEEKRLDTEVKDFIDFLDAARQKTVQQDVSAGNISPCPFEGYSVKIDASTQKYTLFIQCPIATETTIEHTFPSSIQISPSGTHWVVYKYPKGFTTNVSNQTFTIKHLTLKKCVDVTITPAGVINESAKQSC